MRTLTAVVKDGHIVVNEPTTLREGTVLKLQAIDPGDSMDESDRAALADALERSDQDIKAGRIRDARAVIEELRSRR